MLDSHTLAQWFYGTGNHNITHGLHVCKLYYMFVFLNVY